MLIPKNTELYLCPECLGTGFETIDRETCDYCEGSGETAIKPEDNIKETIGERAAKATLWTFRKGSKS